MPRLAGAMVLGPKLAKFTKDYPDVVLEVMVDDSRNDHSGICFNLVL
jgi:hypothetical protein